MLYLFTFLYFKFFYSLILILWALAESFSRYIAARSVLIPWEDLCLLPLPPASLPRGNSTLSPQLPPPTARHLRLFSQGQVYTSRLSTAPSEVGLASQRFVRKLPMDMTDALKGRGHVGGTRFCLSFIHRGFSGLHDGTCQDE